MTAKDDAALVREAADELIDHVDGAEESRGHDTRLSEFARELCALADRLEAVPDVAGWLDKLTSCPKDCRHERCNILRGVAEAWREHGHEETV